MHIWFSLAAETLGEVTTCSQGVTFLTNPGVTHGSVCMRVDQTTTSHSS